MTDKAVSALTSLTGANAATGDLLYIVDISEAAAADRSKKITAQELQNYIKGFPATIGVGGATPAASGAGISFPATMSASSDANTLDDYEEGDASSVVISGTTSAGSGTYSVNSCRYIKIGKQVTVAGYILWTAHTGTGDMVIGGLPFLSDNTANFHQAAIIGYLNNVALSAGNVATAFIQPSQSTLLLHQYPTGGGGAGGIAIDTSGGIIFSMTYIAA